MIRISRLVAVGAATFTLSCTLNGHAQTPAPQPVTTNCVPQFIEAYKRVVFNIKMISAMQNAEKRPTNIPASVRSCNRLENAFKDYSCQVGGRDAKAADLATPCQQIRAYAEKTGVKVPPDVPAPTTTEINDDTAVNTLALAGLKMSMKNSAIFAKAIQAPKTVFFIDGQVYDFLSSITVHAAVRCTVDAVARGQTLVPAHDGVQLKSKFIEEDIKHEHYVTSLSFEGVNWTVDCSKHVFAASETQNGLSFGELKKAFGANAEFTYEP